MMLMKLVVVLAVAVSWQSGASPRAVADELVAADRATDLVTGLSKLGPRRPFFMIWKRESPSGRWLYIAE